MYKQVKLFGHPLHPMVVGFPVAFYTATFACFLIYMFTFDIFWFKVAFVANVAGVVMAAIASLIGIMDFIMLPLGSRVRTTGFKHMGFNLVAFALFFLNIFLQMSKLNVDYLPNAASALAISGIGLICTLFAGFLGWSMVQRHHVGVDLTKEQQALEPEAEKIRSRSYRAAAASPSRH